MTHTETPAPRRRSRGGKVYQIVPENLTDAQHELTRVATLAAEIEADRPPGIDTPTRYQVAMALAVIHSKARALAKRYAAPDFAPHDIAAVVYGRRHARGTEAIEARLEGLCAWLKICAPSLKLTFGRDADRPAVTINVRGRDHCFG